MTTTTPLTSALSPVTGLGTARALLVAGGALFAVGNLLHPLDHGDVAELSPTWEAAHLGFGASRFSSPRASLLSSRWPAGDAWRGSAPL